MPFRVPRNWGVLSLCFLMALAAELAHAQAPTVSGVSIVSAPASGDTYELAEDISVEVTFDRAVDVTGSPQIALNIGGSIRHVRLFKLGTTRLRSLDYLVRRVDTDADGISVGANALTLNGGTITAQGGTANAVLDLGTHAISNSGNHKVDGTRETAPTVSQVTITTGPDGTAYGLGEWIGVLVVFDRGVEAARRNLLRLALAVGGTTRQAEAWNGATGGTRIWFAYFVQAADRDVDGIDVPAGALTLNGTTLRISGGTTNAALSLGAHAISTASNGRVDGSIEVAPTVDRVSVGGPLAGGTFLRGETIRFYVSFDKPVAATGTPQLAFMVGETVREARHVAEPVPEYVLSRGRIVFEYVVAASDRDVDGISIEADALSLNGGTIRIQGGAENALLTLSQRVINRLVGYEVDGSREASVPMEAK